MALLLALFLSASAVSLASYWRKRGQYAYRAYVFDWTVGRISGSPESMRGFEAVRPYYVSGREFDPIEVLAQADGEAAAMGRHFDPTLVTGAIGALTARRLLSVRYGIEEVSGRVLPDRWRRVEQIPADKFKPLSVLIVRFAPKV